MSRTVLAWDRVVTFLIGLLLIAVGLAGILWWLGTFPSWPRSASISGSRKARSRCSCTRAR